MQLHTLKKVTVITEDSVKSPLLRKICELGAGGYTCKEVQGYGSRGARSDQFARNVRRMIASIVTTAPFGVRSS